MDLKALKRILLARWWILLLALVAAVVIAYQLNEYREDQEPDAEAITWVTFIEDPAALERDEFEALLEQQAALATTANSDLLNEVPGPFIPWRMAEIDVEFDQNQIQFIGRGEDQEEANAVARELLENYLAVSPIGAGRDRAVAELEELTTQIGELRAVVAAAEAAVPLTPEQMDIENQRATITGQLTALQGHLAALTVELLNPVDRSAAVIEAEMAETQAEMDEHEAALAALPPLEQPVDNAEDLELLLTQLRLQALEQRWEALYQSDRALAALASEGDLVAQPPTVAAPESRTNIAIAVVVVLVVVSAALVIFERARNITWTTNDLDLDVQPRVFTEVAPRGLDVFERPTTGFWYLSAPRGLRKASVQYLRSALEDHRNAIVAIQGTGVKQVDLYELAGDLAVSVAVSDRKVLLLDCAFDEKNTLVEYGKPKNITLAEMLLTGTHGESPEARFRSTFASLDPVSHGLVAIRAGETEFDSADVLSTAEFETLLATAQEMFDIVLVVGSEVEDPASHVVSKRVDSVIVVGAIGHSVTDNIEAAVRDFAVSRTELLGIVMVAKRRNSLQRWTANKFRRGLWNVIDWFNRFRDRKAVTKSGFEQNLEKYGVADSDKLAQARDAEFEPGVYAEASEGAKGREGNS